MRTRERPHSPHLTILGWHTRWVIDIFIPFWGDPQFLYAAVSSVRAQTSDNWRLTVVDDCYPEDVSGYFGNLNDTRITYLRNPENLGIIRNFAKCQSLAEGEYTVFMGCDDLLLPNYVEVVEAAARIFPEVDIIQPGVEVINEEGNVHLPLADRIKRAIRPRTRDAHVISGESLAKSLLVGDWLYWPSLAFRTEQLKQVRFLPEYQIILDLGLILDLVQQGAQLAIVPEVAFAYRRHPSSLSATALLDGPRFSDEKEFFEERGLMLDRMGWKSAARAARLHITSRAYALTMLPSALRNKKGTRELLTHIFR